MPEISYFSDDQESLNSMRDQAMQDPNFVKMFEEDTSRYYEGILKDGLKQGYGSIVLENGDKYEGQWVRGMR